MACLCVNIYITYTFSTVAFRLSTSLIHEVYKGHQIAIRQVKFQFKKVSFRINMILTIFSLTIKWYPDKHY